MGVAAQVAGQTIAPRGDGAAMEGLLIDLRHRSRASRFLGFAHVALDGGPQTALHARRQWM